MIIGIGTDLCDIRRMHKILLRFPHRLPQRILTATELTEYQQQTRHQAAFLAKRFAAKEAAAKALGVGIGSIAWTDIAITHDKLGAPYLQFSNNAQRLADKKGVNAQHVSLSDERNYALAFVILLR